MSRTLDLLILAAPSPPHRDRRGARRANFGTALTFGELAFMAP